MTHETHERPWHPGESNAYIERAVRRVRERNGMSTLRERLASIAFDAVISRECESECEHGTAALAVYTAAVRDVLADIEREFDPRLSAWLREWAAERGISLEGSGDE